MNGKLPIAYSDAVAERLMDPIDVHKAMKRKDIETAGTVLSGPTLTDGLRKVPIETEWLQSAAKSYNISPNIKDYLMVPVIIFYADIPNKNGFGFAVENLASFSPQHGVPRFKTWRGKPTFHNHQNNEPQKANGVVLDTFLRRMPTKGRNDLGPKGDYWKTLAYLAFDRGKNRDLITQVANRQISTYSMGTVITGGYICSICSREVGTCRHLDMRKPRYGMKLVDTGKERPDLAYVIGIDPVGFEVSIVDVPAYEMAENDVVQFFPNDEWR